MSPTLNIEHVRNPLIRLNAYQQYMATEFSPWLWGNATAIVAIIRSKLPQMNFFTCNHVIIVQERAFVN